MKIIINREDILDLQITMKKEYLLTNGKGGYCSSTVLDCHSRKYHGLLVMPVKQQNGRLFNFLSKLEPTIIIDGREFHLSTNKFPVVIEPTGHKYIESFELEHYPVTYFKIGDIKITKSILMPYGDDTVLVKYDVVETSKPLQFKVMPFMAFREINSLSKENHDLKPRTYFETNGFKFDPYPGLPPIYLQTSVKSVFYPSPIWWRDFEFTKERKRGYEHHEDLFVPGTFELKMKTGDSVIFRASLSQSEKMISTEWNNELKRIDALEKKYENEKEPLKTMKIRGGDYIIEYPDKHKGIVAGYHWFGEWGRDTLISLTGLTVCRGEAEMAFQILKKYTKYEKHGLLPNIISSDGKHAYNSIDTPLLYTWAIQHYLQYTNDKENVAKHLVPTVVAIAKAFIEGKVPMAGIGPDGLLYAGNENTNFTWMDAVVNDMPVTPRFGAAVEINALWYNTLSFLINDFSGEINKNFLEVLVSFRDNFEKHFEDKFWADIDQCFVDRCINDYDKEYYIRPNQLFAIGLPYTCVSQAHAQTILETIDQHLLTPFGLRTLSPRNLRFRGEYKGEQALRDMAYHQGMVWPWLVGIYADAVLKVYGNKPAVKKSLLETFHDLVFDHLAKYGLLHISELVRPNPQYVAKGCIAQAWSMAESIRMLEKLK
jgi:predicted glycogen debranching enzyme